MKRDKLTTMTVEWSKDGRSISLAVNTEGDAMPSEVQIMLVNHLLRELPRGYVVELRSW